MTKQLNLLDFCRRAVGEWQDLDYMQSRLVRVEKDVFIKDIEVFGTKDLNMKLALELMPPGVPVTFPLDFSQLPKEQVESWKCTYVSLYEMFRCGSPTVPICLHRFEMITNDENSKSNICEFQNWTKFVDTEITYESQWLKDVLDVNNLQNLTQDEKEDLYWAHRLRQKGRVLIPAILDSLKSLKMDGLDFVILPTGDKVEVSSVKLRALEVVPRQLHLFKVNFYYQNGGTIEGDLVIPTVTREADSLKRRMRLFARRFDPIEGIVITKYVLEIPLANGKMYIIDPTSMEFGYRGPKGTLIAHGEWDNYVQKFPGKILRIVRSSLYGNFKDAMQEAQFHGFGPRALFVKLSKSIIEYFKRRICNYCGRIEGQHETDPKDDGRYLYVPLSLWNCTGCNVAAYCGSKCQKKDWKNHKTHCKGKK